ncbi:MAG: polysaccharide deacetylase family protein [Clostridiales bacterium]|nr:polysaccharide deacetylase family protein [Clostridiales bacterium]
MAEETSRVDVVQKRKRINIIKTAIIVTLIILFLLPTILCIVLGLRLSKLQRQVDSFFSTYSSIYKEDSKQKNTSGKYAYASTNESRDKDLGDEADSTADTNNIEETDNTDDADILDEPEILDDSDLADDNPITESPNQDSRHESEETTDSVTDGEPDGIYYGKKVYLTFDDGPTYNTELILDILDEYNVKATFFVIGNTDEKAKELYNRIVNEGHVLGMHSYSHRYQEIYNSIEDFDKDFTKLWKLLYDTTGYTPTLYRFPGGSLSFKKKSKIKDFVYYLEDKGMTYYDWNVVNGDAEGKNYTEEQMIDYVLSGVARKKTSIVLMHDGHGKDKTVATLPSILDALISGGAEVLPMDETVPLIQQIKATSVK